VRRLGLAAILRSIRSDADADPEADRRRSGSASGDADSQRHQRLRMRRRLFAVAAGLLALVLSSNAQPVFTGSEIFPPDEFASRRARVMERMGDGVAILQGTTERPGEQPLRQNNQFFYLTGVVEPRAIVSLDGRTKKTTLFLQ